jgi:hypothetical protein
MEQLAEPQNLSTRKLETKLDLNEEEVHPRKSRHSLSLTTF